MVVETDETNSSSVGVYLLNIDTHILLLSPAQWDTINNYIYMASDLSSGSVMASSELCRHSNNNNKIIITFYKQ